MPKDYEPVCLLRSKPIQLLALFVVAFLAVQNMRIENEANEMVEHPAFAAFISFSTIFLRP